MGARITIDPEAVARNWRTLSARSGEAQCSAVVKANAYGHGVEIVAPALWKAGCRTFFVATLLEGHTLRAVLPRAVIYVLNGVFDDPISAVDAALRPFLSSREALNDWPHAQPFALNIDTGMHRLGVTVEEAIALAGEGLAPALIASHFACADTPDHPLNAVQDDAFRAVRAAFPAVDASFANSAALLTRPHAHYDLTRPGIALYGGASAENAPTLEPAARVEARVIQVRDVDAGDSVGYGAAQKALRPSRVAIVSAGYADGYLRAAGGAVDKAPAFAAFDGVRVPLIGRVSMDLIAVDVTDAPCARGDWIELFGPTVRVDEVARASGTIGYELLTGLSRRAERRVAAL